MPNLEQRPDGSWGPATAESFHPGLDVEWTADGVWTLYRTTERASLPIASGVGVLSLWIAWWKARLYWRPRRHRGR